MIMGKYFQGHSLFYSSIFFAAALLVYKTYSDLYYDNKTFAMTTGILLEDLNRWELQMLQSLDFKTIISKEDF